MSRWDWMEEALCATTDTDVDFFSEEPEEIKKAQEVCFDCPVRRECLQYALVTETRFGVWGGADENTLRKALNVDQYGKPVSRVKPMKCPYCDSRNVDLVAMKRIKQRMQCLDCDLSWWARVPTQVVRINAESLEDSDDE